MIATMRKFILGITFLQAIAITCIQASNETEIENLTTTQSIAEDTTLEDDYSNKHKSFVNCPKYDLDPEEYTRLDNGSVYVTAYNKTYTEEFYLLHDNLLSVCAPEDTAIEDDYSNKHKSFANCPKYDLDPEEYIKLDNGSVYVKSYNKTYTEEFYILHDNLLSVCVPEDPSTSSNAKLSLESDSLSVLTAVGIGVSMVCLLIHLLVFAVVPDLKNLPGCNLASLCLSLFLSYLLMIALSIEQVSHNTAACVSVAGFLQFFLMASFLWMFLMSFDVFRSILQATGSLRTSSTGFKVKKYLYNSTVVWGISLCFTTAAMIVDNVDGIHESFKPHFKEFCWFKQKQSLLIFFAGPVFTLIGLNVLLFGISAYNIFANRMRSSLDSQRSNLKKSHMMYFRLSVIMGVTWISGVLAPLLRVLWMWYVFAALNAFQGFFIFLAFTCTSKVKKHFQIKLFGGRRPSEQNLTPTFQSYCYYANSMEKDLNKVVDSTGEKEKGEAIDTV